MPDRPHASFVLRRARPADAAAFAAQMADVSVFGNLMQMPWPSEDLWRQRLEASVAAKESAEVLLVAERDGQLRRKGGGIGRPGTAQHDGGHGGIGAMGHGAGLWRADDAAHEPGGRCHGAGM